jgi:hypothetical protein
VDQVDLPQVRGRPETPDMEEVLVRRAGMRITLNAEVFDEQYRLYGFFAERVCLTETNADDDWLRGNVALHV